MAISRYRFKGPTYIGNQGLIGTHYTWSNGQWVNPSYYYKDFSGCMKEHLRCWDETHPGPPFKEGGPLLMPVFKNLYKTTQIVSGVWKIPNYYKYEGSFHFLPYASYNTSLASISTATAESYGSTAWKVLKPIQPRASAGVFLGELREFLDLFKVKLREFKDLGSNYLNYKFGWTPFLGDIGRMINTMDDIEKTIAFIRKNNGKWLKRSRTLRDEVTSVSTTNCGSRITPVLPTSWYTGHPVTSCIETKISTDHIWCKAKMRYYIPKLKMDSAKDVFSSSLRRRIYGLDITPALVWELMPWSWLTDWFSNVGDVFRAISGRSYDNLVAKYAYVMRHRKIMFQYAQEQTLNGDGPSIRLQGVSVLCENKERAEASPFGFGLEIPDLTASQLAILAALGMTRWLH